MNGRLFLMLVLQLLIVLAGKAQRRVISFNDGWQFHFAADVRKTAAVESVTLPHTWNASEAGNGQVGYTRTAGVYEKSWMADPSWAHKRVFIYFEGANSVASVYINHLFAGVHKGGYTAFCLEITGYLRAGRENTVTVQVSNAYRTDVLPLSGDFNVYGGIHRPVSLIVTAEDCISLLDHASPGVYLVPKSVSEDNAKLSVVTKLSLQNSGRPLELRTRICDAEGQMVKEARTTIRSGDDTGWGNNDTGSSNNDTGSSSKDTISSSKDTGRCSHEPVQQQEINIDKPHLWNGRKDPYLYTVTVQLVSDDSVIDEVKQPLGLRYYRVNPDSGFVLNGSYLDLHGFGRHEDVQGKGSALLKADEEKDISLILDAGATAMRLTHYPHSGCFYDLADKDGIVLWSEIPLVGPGGYTGPGYVNDPELRQQARQVLVELIRQYYNHPSIFFWGLFNELKLDYDDPTHFITELNTLAKVEDPTRLTTCASFLDDATFTEATDVMGWNKYYGWYGGQFSGLGTWADAVHKRFPAKPIAVSEYGAGGCIGQQQEILSPPDPGGKFHPEGWQTLFHEKSWEELNKRRFIWGKFVWCLSDFGSSIRDEGDRKGINDKGLVTYDRSTKKDAFYFYKVNWNPEPMIYLTDKRMKVRSLKEVSVKVYCNAGPAELFINGRSFGVRSADDLNRIIWSHIQLPGQTNRLSVVTKKDGIILQDSCDWEYKAER